MIASLANNTKDKDGLWRYNRGVSCLFVPLADIGGYIPLIIGVSAFLLIAVSAALTVYGLRGKHKRDAGKIKEESSTIRVARLDFLKGEARYFNLKEIKNTKSSPLNEYLDSFPSREGLKVRNWAEDLFRGEADSDFLECDVYMKSTKRIAPSFLRAVHVNAKKRILLVESYLLKSNVLKNRGSLRKGSSLGDFAAALKKDSSQNGATFCFSYAPSKSRRPASESNALSDRVLNSLRNFVLGNQLLIKYSKHQFLVCNFDMYDESQALNFALEVCASVNRELRAKRQKGQTEAVLKCGIVMNKDVLKNADLLSGQARAAASIALESRSTVHIYRKGDPLVGDTELGNFRTEVERIIYGKRIEYSYRPVISLNLSRVVGYLGRAVPVNTAFDSMEELTNYAERANDVKALLNAVVGELLPRFLSERPLKSQSLYIPVRMSQLEYVLSCLIRNMKGQSATVYVLIDDAEVAKKLSPLEVDNFRDTLANIKKGGYKTAFLISGSGPLLQPKIYSLSDAFVVSLAGTGPGLALDTRVRSDLHALAERLARYKKPIIASGLESFNAVELVYNAGIDYISSDAVAPYSPLLRPLGEKTVNALKEIKESEHG